MAGIRCVNGRTMHRNAATKAKCRYCKAASGGSARGVLAGSTPGRESPHGVNVQGEVDWGDVSGANGDVVNNTDKKFTVRGVTVENGVVEQSGNGDSCTMEDTYVTGTTVKMQDGSQVGVSSFEGTGSVVLEGSNIFDTNANVCKSGMYFGRSDVNESYFDGAAHMHDLNIINSAFATDPDTPLVIKGFHNEGGGRLAPEDRPTLNDSHLEGHGEAKIGNNSSIDDCTIVVDGALNVDSRVVVEDSNFHVPSGVTAFVNNVLNDKDDAFVVRNAVAIGSTKNGERAVIVHEDTRWPGAVYIHDGNTTYRFTPLGNNKHKHAKTYGADPFDGLASPGYIRDLEKVARKYDARRR